MQPHDLLTLDRPDRITFNRPRWRSVNRPWDLAEQSDTVELPVKISLVNISWSQMSRSAIVPERNTSRLPPETHGEFGAQCLFPKQFKELLALTVSHT